MKKITIKVDVLLDDELIASVTTTPAVDATPAPLPSVPQLGMKEVDGIRGEAFWLNHTDGVYKVNEAIWFHFKVRNVTDHDISYAGLGVVINDHKSQASWGDSTLRAGAVLEWDDHMTYDKPGKYQIFLARCWAANRGECDKTIDQNGWAWLSDPIELTLTD